jgi:hypothetical protein
MTDQALVTASGLEERGILKKGTAYRMAKLNLIPYAKVGVKGTGIRFSPLAVIEALRNGGSGHQESQ